jgi:hypothetical protein
MLTAGASVGAQPGWASGAGQLSWGFDITGSPVTWELTGRLDATGSNVAEWDRYARAQLYSSTENLLDFQAGRRFGGVTGSDAVVLTGTSGTLAPGSYTLVLQTGVGDVFTSFKAGPRTATAKAQVRLVLR